MTEEYRREVVRSLSRPNRDAALRTLGIPTVSCAGEDWFDLRHLRIGKDEITGEPVFARLCLDYAGFSDVNLARIEFEGSLLRGALFRKAILDNAVFASAHLSDARFDDCSLRHTAFSMATGTARTEFLNSDLDDAQFFRYSGPALFQGGSARNAVFEAGALGGARFLEVDLSGAQFDGAELNRVDFGGTKIDRVDFRDADLSGAHLNAALIRGPVRLLRTHLSGAFLGDLDLSTVDVASVAWTEAGYRLGEEVEADEAEGSTARRRLYSQAEFVYRRLAAKYKELGYTEEAGHLRYRSLEVRRKLLRLRNPAPFSLEQPLLYVSHWVDGYGTRPWRWVRTLVLVVFSFAVVYSSYFFVAQWRERRGCLAAVWAAGRDGLYTSIAASFVFAKPLVDCEPMLRLVFARDSGAERLSTATGPLRFVAAFEAALGVLLLYFGLKMLLFQVGAL